MAIVTIIKNLDEMDPNASPFDVMLRLTYSTLNTETNERAGGFLRVSIPNGFNAQQCEVAFRDAVAADLPAASNHTMELDPSNTFQHAIRRG